MTDCTCAVDLDTFPTGAILPDMCDVCFAADDVCGAEAAEMAYERHLETRGEGLREGLADSHLTFLERYA